jgi:hypothetical protein
MVSTLRRAWGIDASATVRAEMHDKRRKQFIDKLVLMTLHMHIAVICHGTS